MTLRIEPRNATLGADIYGVNLNKGVSDADFQEIWRAWLEHAVLVFPEQHLTEDAQVAFSRRFGRLERMTLKSTREIIDLSNVGRDGQVVDAASAQALFLEGNAIWHADSTFRKYMPKAGFLVARQCPKTGGETEFSDTRAAYDMLSPDRKALLEGLEAVHDYVWAQSLIGGMEFIHPDARKEMHPVTQSVVQVHPDTGRKHLVIGRYASHIVGWSVEEGRALLRELEEFTVQPPRVIAHAWKPGDAVLWDNRCVLHRGRPFALAEARVMRRTTIADDHPENVWAL